MKQKEILLNTLLNDGVVSLNGLTAEEIGNEHAFTSVETPLRPDAFERSEEEKISRIQYHFKEIMETLGLDLSDDSLKGTPQRVAKS